MMSKKNVDQKGRWRNKYLGIRLSPEEDRELTTLVNLSGLTKQDYIVAKLMNKTITVSGNPRIFIALKKEIKKMITELQNIQSSADLTDDQLARITEIMEMYECGCKEGISDAHANEVKNRL